MLGLVFGGITSVLGVIALVLTLLYWLAEGMRIYDHDIGPTTTVPAVDVHDGPPPGVHMPGPSWRPFLVAFGLFAVFARAGVRGLAPRRRRHRPDRDAGRLADRRRPGVSQDGRGRYDRPSREHPRARDAAAAVDASCPSLIVGAVVLQSGVFVDSTGQRRDGDTRRVGRAGRLRGARRVRGARRQRCARRRAARHGRRDRSRPRTSPSSRPRSRHRRPSRSRSPSSTGPGNAAQHRDQGRVREATSSRARSSPAWRPRSTRCPPCRPARTSSCASSTRRP